MYKINDLVFYFGSSSIFIVKDIGEFDVGVGKRNYLRLAPYSKRSIEEYESIYIAIDYAFSSIRPVSNKEDILYYINHMDEIETMEFKTAKHRKMKFDVMVKEKTFLNSLIIAKSIYEIYLRNKELTFFEKEVYTKSNIILIEEISVLLEMSEEEAKKCLFDIPLEDG